MVGISESVELRAKSRTAHNYTQGTYCNVFNEYGLKSIHRERHTKLEESIPAAREYRGSEQDWVSREHNSGEEKHVTPEREQIGDEVTSCSLAGERSGQRKEMGVMVEKGVGCRCGA
ncbi:hypothetical protein PIB30_045713 [Stylosanthes scabra]|uniref:Uncharacterized protein n=1 Tax=Stylosanthes scabra TaxID=79078 RepID=A0ABU6VFJ6_9FABA|nr:hypothetical protein [Stylosanthes scabra]